MASLSSLMPAPNVAPGSALAVDIYATGGSFESAVFWMVLVIAVILGAGLILYIFFVRGSYERERQAALALIGRRGQDPAARGISYYPGPVQDYSYKGEVPDAVEQAMASMRGGGPANDEVELVDESEEGLPATLYTDSPRTYPSRRAAPQAARPAYDGRTDYPPREIPRAPPPRRGTSPLDDLLHEEDRQLLREEELEADQEVPALLSGEEEVTFEDEPEPYTPTEFPGPRRVRTREQPAWEKIVTGQGPVYEEPMDVTPVEAPAYGPSAPAPADGRPPPLRREVFSGPLADLLLEKDIMQSVRDGKRIAPPPARREAGPAWAEGRPVFSKPLEAPEGASGATERAPDRAMDEQLGELSHRLKSMDEKAGPRLHPKAEAKLGVQEKKFLDAMRQVQAKKREEDRQREEDGRRLLEEQMRELDHRKKEEEAARLAEQRRREQERLDRERRQQEEMRRWEEARRETQQKQHSEEDARAEEERARQEALRREDEKRRRAAASRQDQSATIDDVLSRIGIKK